MVLPITGVGIKNYQNNINNVPPTMNSNPTPDFKLNFSLKIIYAKAIVTNVLNLSIGTTTLPIDISAK